MKIALFTDFYFDEHPTATVVKNLKKALEEEGMSVYVLTAADSSKDQNEEGVFSFTSANIKRYPHFKLSLSPFLSAKRIVRGLKIDIIHNFAIGSMAAAAATCSKDLEIPSINTIMEMLPYTYSAGHGSRVEKFVKEAASKYLKWINSFFTVTTFPTKYAKSLTKDVINDQAVSKAEVIPFPIGEEKVTNSNREVGYVGNIEKHTEFSEVLKNAEAIKNKTKKEFSIYSTNNGRNEVGITHIHYKDRWKAYGKCAVYVELPSYSAYNNFAMEFLASGKPVVAPKNSPLFEAIARIDSRLVFEEKYVSEAVQHALENSKELKEKFKELAKEHNNSVKEYISLYREVIKT